MKIITSVIYCIKGKEVTKEDAMKYLLKKYGKQKPA